MQIEETAKRSLVSLTGRLRLSPFTLGLTLALIVGVVAGLGAVIFRSLIDFLHVGFFDRLLPWLSSLIGPYGVILIPALGGLIVGPLVYFFAREAKGHGVPEVMLAVSKSSGRMRGRVSIVKAIASSVCIGSGGSVGREGPIVQIGSSAASFLGQRFGVTEGWLRLLVACGAAGGISATFNTPIAGVLFAIEVILRTFSIQNFGVVVLSSVAADVVAQAILGNEPAFQVPSYALASFWELGLYALLGVLSALLALAFVRLLYFLEDRFEDVRLIPEWFQPVIGGLGVGIVGLFYPQVFGVGYDFISEALTGGAPFVVLVALVFLKPLATSLTLGSGGSGGVFAPSLFIGAVTGVAFGSVAQELLPGIAGPAGGYGLVGMASVFAGAASAPLTAIVIVFEMTRDYMIILPLMLGVVVSTFVSRSLSRENIYTLKLLRRGIDLEDTAQQDFVSTLRVGDIMRTDYPTVASNVGVDALPELFEEYGVHGLPVVTGDGALVGMVTMTDVERALVNGHGTGTAGAIATRTLVTASSDQTVAEILVQPGASEVGYFPVLDPDAPRRLKGILRRHDIIRAYANSLKRGGIG